MATAATTTTANPAATTPASQYASNLSGLVSGNFANNIGVRDSTSSPGTAEYYRTDTGQGFSDPSDLFAYASSLGKGPITSFGQIQGNSTSDEPGTGSYSTGNALEPNFDFDTYNTDKSNYYSSLTDSPALDAARSAYTQYAGAAQQGVDALSGQGRGIPLQLVTGQQGLLQKQAEDEEGILQGNITDATQAQTASAAAAKAKLDQDNTDLSALQQYQATQTAALNAKEVPKTVTAGTSEVAYNPATGTYDTVSSTPKVVANTKYGTSTVDPTDGSSTSNSSSGGGSSSGSGSGSGTPTGADLTAAVNSTANTLSTKYFTKSMQDSTGNPVIGGDNYASSEAYNAARDAWAADNLPVAKFDSLFKKYVNPANASQYDGAGSSKTPAASSSTPVTDSLSSLFA